MGAGSQFHTRLGKEQLRDRRSRTMFDVIIIGAGVTGCAAARELSRYQAEICVIDKCEDVGEGTSKANSAIIHAGFDAPAGSLMAEMNVRGNELMGPLCEELDVPFKRNGALVVCVRKNALDGLQELYDRGIANGVKDMKILNRSEALQMEPNLSESVQGALYAPSSGIICPFILTEALAENACANGVEFRLGTKAENVFRDEQGIWHIGTDKGELLSRSVINAAGVYADVIHNMVSENQIHITPRRGEYLLLDKDAGTHVSHTIFPQPTKLGKGVLVTPTIHGNLIIGPTAQDIEDREGVNTSSEGLQTITVKANEQVRNLPLRKVITSFAGLRAHEDHHEFIIGEVKDAPYFFDCAGIESPGLASSPAIGERISLLIKEKLSLQEKKDWNPRRKGITDPRKLTMEERNELIRKEPAYGNIICRCESVSEGEILDAIRRTPGARTLDGVKRRVRAGMGRCQAGFCSPKVMEILHRELDIPYEEITKGGKDGVIVFGRTKNVQGGEA